MGPTMPARRVVLVRANKDLPALPLKPTPYIRKRTHPGLASIDVCQPEG